MHLITAQSCEDDDSFSGIVNVDKHACSVLSLICEWRSDGDLGDWFKGAVAAARRPVLPGWLIDSLRAPCANDDARLMLLVAEHEVFTHAAVGEWLRSGGHVDARPYTCEQPMPSFRDVGTLLHQAAFHGNAGAVRRLLQSNASVDLFTTSSERETALSIAARLGSTTATITPKLHWTHGAQYVEIVSLLLEARARTDMVNGNGKTPIELAREALEDQLAVLAGLETVGVAAVRKIILMLRDPKRRITKSRAADEEVAKAAARTCTALVQASDAAAAELLAAEEAANASSPSSKGKKKKKKKKQAASAEASEAEAAATAQSEMVAEEPTEADDGSTAWPDAAVAQTTEALIVSTAPTATVAGAVAAVTAAVTAVAQATEMEDEAAAEIAAAEEAEGSATAAVLAFTAQAAVQTHKTLPDQLTPLPLASSA